MTVNIVAKSYSGKYGTDADVGDIIHVEVSIGTETSGNAVNKEIILLIDVSGSMEDSMKSVKSSLLAFRDSIVGKSHLEMETLSSEDRDTLLRDKINIRLITFSNTAKEVWSFESGGTFEQAVLKLEVEAMTNMGDALKLAFEKVNPTSFSWIIVMTDGESNKGPCQTSESFQRLVTASKPLNCKVVSLGYGSSFDPEVLNVVGSFAYVESVEMIPVVLGNLASEIMTSVGFNCVVDIVGSTRMGELTDDTIIVPEGEDEVILGRTIGGNRVIEALCCGNTYHYVYLPHGRNSSRDQLETYKTINIQYTDISTGVTIYSDHQIDHTHDIVHSHDIPPNSIREIVFETKKKVLVQRLYEVIQKQNNRKSLKKEVDMIEKVIEGWGDDDLVTPHKEEILRMIKNIDVSNNRVHRAGTVLNYLVGTGYSMVGLGDDTDSDSPTNQYLGSTLTGTNYYLTSPLINNNQ